MSLQQLRSVYEKRRMMLTNALKKDLKMDKSRKDQLSGAISEIDILVKTIDSLRDQEIIDDRKLTSQRITITDDKNMLQKIHSKVKFEESLTKKNLLNIFVRKCETRTKYEFFASLAKNEGYENVAHTFTEFADHEKEHAKILFRYLNLTKSTKENILQAANMEQHYHKELYTQFEEIARAERFIEIADLFKELSQIEAEHEKKFLKLLNKFHAKNIFKSEYVVKWKCRNCGRIIEAKEAPRKCIVCKKPQSFFEVHVEN